MIESAPQLLVSVRNAAEAEAALAGGCDILDVKEPSQGSLGMAAVESIADVVDVAASSRTVGVPSSAALGEVAQWRMKQDVSKLPAGLTYLKLGLSGLGGSSRWINRWIDIRNRFEESADAAFHWIAVAYADYREAHSPHPTTIIEAAVRTGCAGVLFDTFQKDGRTLLDWIEVDELHRFSELIRPSDLKLAIAGGLRLDSLNQLGELPVDVIAIRTAGCLKGKRSGDISTAAVRAFKLQMQADRSPACLR